MKLKVWKPATLRRVCLRNEDGGAFYVKILTCGLFFFLLLLCGGCGSSLNDASLGTTQTTVEAPRPITVNISASSLGATAEGFDSKVATFRASLLTTEGAHLATVTVPRDTSRDIHTLVFPNTVFSYPIVTIEALDIGGHALFSLKHRVGSSRRLSVSAVDFSPGPLSTAVQCGGSLEVSELSPYRGLGGSLKVKGWNLDDIGALAFDTTVVHPTEWSGQDCVNHYEEWLTVVAPEKPVGTRAVVTFYDRMGHSLDGKLFYFYTNSYQPMIESLTPDTGPLSGGTQVTLNGRGFTGAYAVTFGDLSTRVTSFVSDRQIIVTTPVASQAGEYPLRVVYENSRGLAEQASPESDVTFSYHQ
jgi:hypothetical protein